MSGGYRLIDRLQWDVASPISDPDAFARGLARDLRLDTAFIPAVALSIRKQVCGAGLPHVA